MEKIKIMNLKENYYLTKLQNNFFKLLIMKKIFNFQKIIKMNKEMLIKLKN